MNQLMWDRRTWLGTLAIVCLTFLTYNKQTPAEGLWAIAAVVASVSGANAYQRAKEAQLIRKD